MLAPVCLMCLTGPRLGEVAALERRESASRENGNSLMLTRKEHLGPMFGGASDHCQVLASLKRAEASRALRVAISLGV